VVMTSHQDVGLKGPGERLQLDTAGRFA
jgi:hypothetical protein